MGNHSLTFLIGFYMIAIPTIINMFGLIRNHDNSVGVILIAGGYASIALYLLLT